MKAIKEILLCASVVLLPVLGVVLHAAESFWVSDSGEWNDPQNWLGTVPNDVDDIAVFTTFPESPSTINVETALALEAIRFGSPAGLELHGSETISFTSPNAVIASSSPNPLTLSTVVEIDSQLNIATETDNTSIVISPSGQLSGFGGVTKSGPGLLTLAGTLRGWSGQLTVADGVVRVDTTRGLPRTQRHRILENAKMEIFFSAFPLEVSGGTVDVSQLFGGDILVTRTGTLYGSENDAVFSGQITLQDSVFDVSAPSR